MNTLEEISASAFDPVASSYDVDFTFSNIGKLQRKRVYHFLEKVLPKLQERQGGYVRVLGYKEPFNEHEKAIVTIMES